MSLKHRLLVFSPPVWFLAFFARFAAGMQPSRSHDRLFLYVDLFNYIISFWYIKIQTDKFMGENVQKRSRWLFPGGWEEPLLRLVRRRKDSPLWNSDYSITNGARESELCRESQRVGEVTQISERLQKKRGKDKQSQKLHENVLYIWQKQKEFIPYGLLGLTPWQLQNTYLVFMKITVCLVFTCWVYP